MASTLLWAARGAHRVPMQPRILCISQAVSCRARYAPLRSATTRYSSSGPPRSIEAGHISLEQNEGLLFINNLFPPKLQWLLRMPIIGEASRYEEVMKRVDKPHLAASEVLRIIQRALPQEPKIEVTGIIPRFTEGGAFVKYARTPGLDDEQIEKSVKDHLAQHPIKPWFNPFQTVEAARVLGKPWIEDLFRFPSPRIKVEFLPPQPEASPAELTQEVLYSVFRRYGKLVDIAPGSGAPKNAFVEFSRRRHAILARNCTHGLVITESEGGGKAGTLLRITYERKIKFSYIKDWILSHPRIVIPAIAAFVATMTVIIFDPIRTFFIKMKVKATSEADQNSAWRWIRKQVSKANFIGFGRNKRDPDVLEVLWEDRKNDISQLQSWLTENTGTFIVIQGPAGSGKRELVLDQALKDKRYRVVIDCKPIQEARGDAATIATAAAQVGYRPMFSWMNSFSSFIDLAAQGMIGTKAGFSETLDAQLSKIWQNTGVALKQVTLEGRRKDDKDSQLSDEEYLDAHPEKRPVVVIDNFLHKAGETDVVYDKISEWAAALTSANIAHVIFLTTDISYSKPLNKALPNQIFKTISMGDCSLEVGKKFVLDYLGREDDSWKDGELQKRFPFGTDELDRCIETLGGRLTDLEFLAHRMKAGESPQHAVNRIIEQSASEILKIYILDADPSKQHWTREQAWHLIKALANSKNGVMSYNDILLSDLFKDNGETTVAALQQAELLNIVSENGRPHAIKPGKPVYHAAFKRLTEDKILRSRLDLATLAQLISDENKSVAKYEDELQRLATLPKQPSALTPRVQWLLNKLYGSQTKVEKFEKDSAQLKAILQSDGRPGVA
ncbi:mitochondrial escape protein 2 [Paecilomyces lecythidis]|uniref:Mitochondrial escape protein 2 n=1 Tax=Paecilomyces lecythidis TaxID=3004212 RepID=A0ABR3X0Y0_9EURO